MPTIRTGSVGLGGSYAINQDQRVPDIMDRVFEYDPEASPLLTVLYNRLDVMRATDPLVKHLEDEPVSEWDTLGTTINSSATQLDVGAPAIWRAGDIGKFVTSGETFRVVSVDEGNSLLNVTRSWGTTAAAGVTAGASTGRMLNMGGAEMEGDLAPPAKQTITVTKTNYCQIFKETVHTTKTAENAKLYGGNDRRRQRRKASARHKRDMEQALLHGEKNLDTSSARHPIRSMGGLDEHITTNVLSAGGTLTESAFNDFLAPIFRYSADGTGKKSKLLLASNEVLGAVSFWGRQKVRINDVASKRYGLAITEYISPYGRLNIINHPLLEEGYAGVGYVVDLDGIKLRPYRRTMLETDIQAKGEDAFKDQWITEMGASFALEKTMGKLEGVTGGA